MSVGRSHLHSRWRQRRRSRNRLQVELLEKRLLLAAGDPDLSFGLDGVATVPFRAAGLTETPAKIVAADDGKFLIAQNVHNSSSFSFRFLPDIVVARYNGDGTPDRSFADVGMLQLGPRSTVGSGADTDSNRVSDMVLDPDGSVVLLSKVGDNRTDAIVQKLTPAGARAPEFSLSGQSIGYHTYNFAAAGNSRFDNPVGITPGDDGSYYLLVENGGMTVVAKILPDSFLDPEFGTDGIVQHEIENFFPGGLARLDSGEMVVGGLLDGSLAAIRIGPDGEVDGSYGVDGIATLTTTSVVSSFAGLEVDEAGRVIMSGTAENGVLVGRLSTEGSVDTSFAGNGTTDIDLGGEETAAGMQVDDSGRLLIFGHTGANSLDAFILRLMPDGSPDTSVSASGGRVLDLGTAGDRIVDVAPTGSEVLGLVALSNSATRFNDSAIVRLNSSLQLDTSFGDNGTVLVDSRLERTLDTVTAHVLDDDSVVLIGGNAARGIHDPAYAFVAAKLTAEGIPDAGFGDEGRVALAHRDLRAGFGIVLRDGSLVAAGRRDTSNRWAYAFVKFTADGRVDNSFGDSGLLTDLLDNRRVSMLSVLATDDGGFLAIGNAITDPLVELDEAYVLTKYVADGSRDTNFGDNGELVVTLGPVGVGGAGAMLVDDAGRILVFGSLRGEFFIDRYLSNGTPDTGFGGGGRLLHAEISGTSGAGVTQMPGGGYTIFNSENQRTFLNRVDADFQLITSFGFNGRVEIPESVASLRIAVDPDGGMLFPVIRGSEFGVTRISAEGGIDPLFGAFGEGFVESGTFGGVSVGNLVLDSQKRLVVGATISVPGPRLSAFRLENGPASCGAEGCIRIAEQLPVIDEADGVARVTLVRDRGTAGDVSVRLRTLRDVVRDAEPGEDYTPVDQRVVFASGQTEAVVEIPIVADDIDESPDTILVSIDEAEGGAALENPQDARITIARQGVNPSALDVAFGDNGYTQVFMSEGLDDLVFHDSVQQPDGKIVAVGSIDNNDFLTLRFTNEGLLDHTFSGDGISRTDMQSLGDSANAVDLQSDGKIVVVGLGGETLDFGLNLRAGGILRMLPDGRLDRSFGPDGSGRLFLDPEILLQDLVDVKVLPDDSMIVLGVLAARSDEQNRNVFESIVIKLTPSGEIDPTFGVDGVQVLDDFWGFRPTGRRLAMDGNGRIFAVGRRLREFRDEDDRIENFSHAVVAALLPDGSIDTSFGDGGSAVFPIPDRTEMEPAGIVIDTEGRVVGAGTFEDERIAVFRLNSNGSVDDSFGDGGISLLDDSFGETAAFDVAMTPNGRIWVSGFLPAGSFESIPGVAAFLPSGRPDPAMNGIGVQNFPVLVDSFFRASSLVVQATGEIVYVGSSTIEPPEGRDQHSTLLFRLRGGDAAGEVGFEFGSVEVDENRGEALLEVRRTNGAGGEVSIHYETVEVTATAEDFEHRSGDLLFGDLEASQFIRIPFHDNDEFEGPEQFRVVLSQPTGGAQLGAHPEITVSIVDGPGDISLAAESLSASESQGRVNIAVRRSGGSDGVVSARIRTNGGSATAGADYLTLDERVTFADSETLKIVRLNALDDPITEGIESIQIELSDPDRGAMLGDRQASTIRLFDAEQFQGTTAGSLDLSFSGNGVSAAVPGAIGIHNLANGGHVVASRGFSVFGRLADGEADPSFGEDGVATIDLKIETGVARAEAFAVDSAGRLLLGGWRNQGFESDFVVVRYHPDGAVDASFGQDGIAAIDLGEDDRALALLADRDGIYVAGSSGSVFQRKLVVVRLLNDGSLDSSFAAGGTLLIDHEQQFAEATTLVRVGDRIVVGGHLLGEEERFGGLLTPRSDVVLHRFDSNGSIDPGFGDAGTVIPSLEDKESYLTNDDRVRKLFAGPDGKLTLVGSTNGEFIVARLNPDGSKDTEFSDDGSVVGIILRLGRGIEGLDFAMDAIQAEDGTIVIAGDSDGKLSVARLLPNGRPDPEFGTGGVRLYEGTFLSGARAITRATEGGYLIATRFGHIVKLIETTVCPPEGCVQFDTTSGSVNEGGLFEVRVSRPVDVSAGEITVPYFTIDGSAIAGLDYESTSGTITFGDTESTAVLHVPALDDSEREGNERFYLVLAAPTGGAVLGGQYSIPISVNDDQRRPTLPTDPTPSVSVGSLFVPEDVGTAQVRVSHFGDFEEPIEFDFTTVEEGSATAGLDYIPASGTITVTPGEFSTVLPIEILFDQEREGPETFRVELSGVVGGRLGTRSAVVTITDTDATVCGVGPGSLDASFAGGGVMHVDPVDGNGDFGPEAVDVAPDGHVVQVGRLNFENSSPEGIVVIRYLPDGELDDGFGDGGIVRIPDLQQGTEFVEAVRILDDGSVLVVGHAYGAAVDNSLFIAKLRSNGQFDTSFADGGVQYFRLVDIRSRLGTATIGSDGSVYLAGSTAVQWKDPAGFHEVFLVGGSFGSVGYRASAQTAGTIVRIGPDGEIDRRFGGDGSIVLAAGVGLHAVDHEGRLIAFQSGSIVRFNTDGTLDDTVVDGGFSVAIPLPADAPTGEVTNTATITQISVGDDGDLFAFGTFSQKVDDPDAEFSFFPLFERLGQFVARFKPDGTLQTAYGEGGIALVNQDEPRVNFPQIPGFEVLPFNVSAMGVQPDGRVLLIGNALGQLALKRFLPDGRFDFGFGGVGLARIPGPSTSSLVALQANNSTTLLSLRDRSDFAVARLLSGTDVGAFRLGDSTYRVAENGGELEIMIRRVCGVDGPTSVRLRSVDGTAVGGSDFATVDQIVDFPNGDHQKIVTISILDDDESSGDLQFTLELIDPANGAEVVTVPTSNVTIVDDDQPGRFRFRDGLTTVDETDQTVTLFVDRLDGDDGEVSIDVAVVGGSATAGADYDFGTRTLVFANGVTTQEFTIPIIDDAELEAEQESIRLALENPTGGAEFGFIKFASVAIVDDELAEMREIRQAFSVATESDRVSEAAGFLQFTIHRSNGSTGERVVSYSISSDTATDGFDYLGGSGSVTFVDGQIERTLTIPIINDGEVEGDEMLSIRVSESEISLTIEDDDIALAELDYGDAPAEYGTLLLDDGPRHHIVTDFQLGETVDAENDGEPSPDALADAGDDGIAGLESPLSVGGENSITVTAVIPADVAAGLLQGWIDLNQDGRFDSGEQVVRNAVLTEPGQHNVTFVIPQSAETGSTVARFRFSSLASIPPTGPAPNGEAEDYQVVLEQADQGPPWQNSRNRFDVNDDGVITPVGDVLPMVNQINRRTLVDERGQLPIPPVPPRAPPPYYDVSGDNLLTAVQDVLPVMNLINRSALGEGEAATPGPANLVGANRWQQPVTRATADPAIPRLILAPGVDAFMADDLQRETVVRDAQPKKLELLADLLESLTEID